MKTISSEIVVCIPCFNEELYVGQTLQSLIRQTYPNFEIVISDNCSTDSTFDICKKYANLDSRIHLYRNKTNIGSFYNGMRLLLKTKSDYIVMLGAHDYISNNFLEKHYSSMLDNDKYSISFSKTKYVDHLDRYIKDGSTESIMNISGSNVERYVHSVDILCDGSIINQFIRRKFFNMLTFKNVYGIDLIALSNMLYNGFYNYDHDSFYYRRIVKQSEDYMYKHTGQRSHDDQKYLLFETYMEDFLKLPLTDEERRIWTPIFKRKLLKRFGHLLKTGSSNINALDSKRNFKISNDIRIVKNIRLYAGDVPDSKNYAEWIGLSLKRNDNRHIQHDLRNRLPFPDCSIEAFQSEDVFEHIHYDELLPIINDIYRVLKPNGLFRLSLPDFRCDVLYERSIKNERGEIIFDPDGGGTFEKPGHLWFPRIELVRELIEKSLFQQNGSIEYLHYTKEDGTYVTNNIDYSKGYVQRTPDHDKRVMEPYRPMSIVVDMIKI